MRAMAALVGVMIIAVAGCGGGESMDEPEPAASEEAGAEEIPCKVGAETEAYVPGGPAVVLGCVRLGISGKTVELSTHSEMIPPFSGGPVDIVCVNPVLPGRGPKKGLFLPSVCPNDPVTREGSRTDLTLFPGYELVLVSVIGGTPVKNPMVSFGGGESEPQMFEADEALVKRIGAKRPFSVLVTELPLEAVCDPITIEASGELPVSLTWPVKPVRCERVSRRGADTGSRQIPLGQPGS